MLTLPPDLLGRDVELGTVEVTADSLRSYAASVGDRTLRLSEAPLGFALAIRGGPVPAVDLSTDTISVHGGHAITAHRALTVPCRYTLRARVAEVFEKNGRSGPLTVIVRQAEIRAPDGVLVTTIEDQQIVRWRGAESAGPPAAPSPHRVAPHQVDEGARPSESTDLEVGSLIAFQRRAAPSAAAIATYAGGLGDRVPFFTDDRFARSLGFADVIVPGPLQSALLEALLRERIPDWSLRRLGLTFRVSLTAGEPMAMSVVVIEHRSEATGAVLVCDLSLENGDGERAAIGTAELLHR